MIGALILLTLLLPLGFAAVIGLLPRARPLAIALSPLAVAPGLAIALLAEPGDSVALPWVLLDTSYVVDEAGRTFLLFTSILWTAASFFARSYLVGDARRHRFFFYFLLVASGNYGVLLAGDVASFYTSFALMTFSAYGFIVHAETDFAYKAGRIYVALAVVGEFMLLSGLIIASFAAGSVVLGDIPGALAEHTLRDVAAGLLLAGFGVKVGAIPLHVWLPLAHPAAPTPASAVLSGTLIKAGVFGWLRFLPLGEATMTELGLVCVVLGLAAAFYGVAIGLMQDLPKTNLAYSSISQMGIVTFGLGVALAEPAAAPLAVTAISVIALHHGLAKGGLFLATGLLDATGGDAGKRLVLRAGLILGAASMAGVLLSSGFFAKEVMKEVASQSPDAWYGTISSVFPLTQTATTLLMLRFLHLTLPATAQQEASEGRPGMWLAWLTVVACMLFLVWPASHLYNLEVVLDIAISPGTVWNGTWPILLGVAIYAGLSRLALPSRLRVPPGDVLLVADWAWHIGRPALERSLTPAYLIFSRQVVRRLTSVATAARAFDVAETEVRLASWRLAGIFLILAFVAIFGALSLG